MTMSTFIELMQHGMWLLLQLSAPVLLLSLLVGLAVSVFQAVTQINEATLSFIPKAVTVFAALVFFGPWMVTVTLDFMQQLMMNLPNYAR